MVKKYVFIPCSFLVIDVCNQGNTLCSPCTSDNTGIWRNMFQLTGAPVLSDAGVFCSSTVLLTAKGKFLGSATIAYGEEHTL